MMTVILVLHFMVCFVLITVVLLQRGKGADLGAALGGGGANTVFGSRGAGNFLTKLTTGSAIVFMMTSLSLAYLDDRNSEVELFDRAALEAEQAAAEGTSSSDPDQAGSAGLEEIDFNEIGGLEEVDPATTDSGSPSNP